MKDLSLPKLHFKVFFCFVLILSLLFLASGCGGKKSEQTEAENDADSTDEDFDTVEEDTEGTEEEIEETEENSDNDNGKPDIDIEPLPKPDNDRDSDNPKNDNDTNSNEPSTNECHDAGGQWINEEIHTCYKYAYCDAKPDNNTRWNYDTGSRYRLYYENGEWSEPYETEYNEEKGPCHFICNALYFWTGSECLSPCDADPCLNIEYSNGICRPISHSAYFCLCDAGYTWKPGQCVKNPEKTAFGNICTGQKRCYNNKDNYYSEKPDIPCTAPGEDFFGQDAYYAYLGKCIQQDFSLKETGIENENTIVDNNLKLEWQQTIPKDKYKWENAVNYCNDLEYGGYNDWRLPTPHELLSTIDHYHRRNRENDDSYFWYFKDTNTADTFWTSKPCVYNPDLSWYFHILTAYFLGYVTTDESNKVRCVRGETLPQASFTTSTENGDEIVTDNTTGLVWQKGNVSGKKWQEALEYCENLNYAGYTDWRLPNINELASLLSYDRYAPASDFPDISHEYFWSSTTFREQESSAMQVFFYNGYVRVIDKNIFSYVKCVR